ncbi:MAG TPA: hypothetical protein VEF92_05265 [Burkholderiales bacterium]|nr:hypothetical protein [Burkholderiales bacterium]
MKPFDQFDDPRRRILIQALAAGFFSAPWGAAAQSVFGSTPRRLPAGQSIYRASGRVLVNSREATLATPIKPGDVVETAPGGELVFVLAEEAFILRGESRVVIENPPPSSPLKTALRLATGKLLSVFGRGRPTRIVTATATIGVRGTGVYAESDPEQTYFCTCYGVADITANNDRQSKETVAATHHNRPLYIAAKASAGNSIRRAPFINHTDQELMLIEALVGRTPPFVFPMNDYNAPRREYP